MKILSIEMNRMLKIYLGLVFLILLTKNTNAQFYKSTFNDYFIKYQLYPLSLPRLFIDSPLNGEIESIDYMLNDTAKYKINFSAKKVSEIVFDSISWKFSYRLGRLSRITVLKGMNVNDETKTFRFFSFTWIFNDDLKYTQTSCLGKTKKYSQKLGSKTMSKSKFMYQNGRINKMKIYGWHPVAQRLHFSHYSLYTYENDTIVSEKGFDSNDSLAFVKKHIFNKKGNILNVSSLIKKKVNGWGIDVTYYTYNGNEIENRKFEYKFDNQNNWIEKQEYLNNLLVNKTERIIKYKN